jgi:hypothetical protein
MPGHLEGMMDSSGFFQHSPHGSGKPGNATDFHRQRGNAPAMGKQGRILVSLFHTHTYIGRYLPETRKKDFSLGVLSTDGVGF